MHILPAGFIGPLIGLACGSLIHTNTVFWALSLAAVLYLVPDMWLKAKSRNGENESGRVFRMRSTCWLSAWRQGLGLDQAMLRVGQELIISHPDIHHEFMQVNFEQLAGKPRLEAWKSTADRTQIAEFSSICEHADTSGPVRHSHRQGIEQVWR